MLLINATSTPMGAAMFNVLPLFALHIGASVGILGLIYALLWVTDVMQYLAAPLVKHHSKKSWLASWFLLTALSFTGIFLIPFLPASAGPGWPIAVMLGVVGLYNFVLSIGLAAWSPYVQRVIPLEVTGEFLGRSAGIISGCTLMASLAASLVLGSHPPLWRFYAVFALANAIVYARGLIAARLPAEPTLPHPVQPATPAREALLAPLRDRASRHYTLLAMAVVMLGAIPGPLFSPYLSRGLGLPDSLVVVVRTSTMLAPALLGRIIGMSCDRRPFLWLIALGLAGGGLSSLALALLPSTAGTATIAVLGIVALCFSGIGTTVAHTALGRKRFALAKPPFEAEFLGLTNAAIGIGVAAGSITGGLLPGFWQPLAGSQHSFRWAFAAQAVAAALAASAAVIAYRRQGKSRRESHIAADTLARRRSGE